MCNIEDHDDFKTRNKSAWGLLQDYIEEAFTKFGFIQLIMQKKRVYKQLLSIRQIVNELLQSSNNNNEQLLIQIDQKFKKLGF